eukprot:7159655-Lingulodinium_polyedra.AAC.1
MFRARPPATLVAVEALLATAALPHLVGEVPGVPGVQREVAVLRLVSGGQPVLSNRRHGPVNAPSA